MHVIRGGFDNLNNQEIIEETMRIISLVLAEMASNNLTPLMLALLLSSLHLTDSSINHTTSLSFEEA